MPENITPCLRCGRRPVLITGSDGIKLFTCIHCGPFDLQYGFSQMGKALLDWIERQKVEQIRFTGENNERA